MRRLQPVTLAARRPVSHTLIALLALVLLAPTPSLAPPIHHWRFETDPGFLSDSISAADLSDNLGPFQATLPATGRGSQFGIVVPDSESAAEYAAASHLLFTTVAPPTGDFTIEVFVHFDALAGSWGDHLAGPARAGTANTIGWTFHIRYDGWGGTQPNELVMFLSDPVNGMEAVGSGVVLETGKDYSLAAVVRMAARNVTFLVQNLTDAGPLQIVVAPHTRDSLIPIPDFGIGNFTQLHIFTVEGLIDEVRYSDSALAFAEMLNPPPPCPGDIDNDGDTDVFDFSEFATTFGQTVPVGTGGDIDNDGDVDVFDFSIFAPDFGCPLN